LGALIAGVSAVVTLACWIGMQYAFR